jgi:hypothetical protein
MVRSCRMARCDTYFVACIRSAPFRWFDCNHRARALSGDSDAVLISYSIDVMLVWWLHVNV